jgi:hypothetical protein
VLTSGGADACGQFGHRWAAEAPRPAGSVVCVGLRCTVARCLHCTPRSTPQVGRTEDVLAINCSSPSSASPTHKTSSTASNLSSPPCSPLIHRSATVPLPLAPCQITCGVLRIRVFPPSLSYITRSRSSPAPSLPLSLTILLYVHAAARADTSGVLAPFSRLNWVEVCLKQQESRKNTQQGYLAHKKTPPP